VPVSSRLEALVVGRAHTAAKPLATRELVEPLAKFAPGDITDAAWRELLDDAIVALRARGILDDTNKLLDRDELARLIGTTTARSWTQLATRVFPGLALGIDDKVKLADQDAWAAAIAARALGVWMQGAPPSLPALCDALAWHRLDLAGKPQRCPSAVRALFVRRELGNVDGAPEKLVRLLAAREVGAVRPDLRALREALVRMWVTGRSLGRAQPGPEASSFGGARPFATEVKTAATAARAGAFGDRKVFIASVWKELTRDPSYAMLSLDEFKARLVAAHRAGDLALARADLVAAMDPELVRSSETTTDGASFHFIVKEAS
jgi:hypothetical protein